MIGERAGEETESIPVSKCVMNTIAGPRLLRNVRHEVSTTSKSLHLLQ